MGFSTKRGRPKAKEIIAEIESGKDLGTPELRLRRAFNMTKEVIDACKDRGILGEEEHRAAVHFRWLYTILFGAPNISALDVNKGVGRDLRAESEIWRTMREREYAMAVEKLRADGSLKVVMNIAIFNHFPRFLTGVEGFKTSQVIQNSRELAKLREGLGTLVSLWYRPTAKYHKKTAPGFNKVLS